MHTKVRQLTAVAAFLHTTDGNARIGRAVAINKHSTDFQLERQTIGNLFITAPDGGAEAKFAVVGDLQRMLWIPGDRNSGYRAKQLLPERVMSLVTSARMVGA
ncbi:Uncharacterised protein [Pantoea agglomerans]|uniref:Uncharacterized protein n=1 Tax=Enterobacter agglomerans TaxID=549 RepID=A0A379LRV6_ENTAG|nr:Uncharacterised protein [Pantoea agglomerans]